MSFRTWAPQSFIQPNTPYAPWQDPVHPHAQQQTQRAYPLYRRLSPQSSDQAGAIFAPQQASQQSPRHVPAHIGLGPLPSALNGGDRFYQHQYTGPFYGHYSPQQAPQQAHHQQMSQASIQEIVPNPSDPLHQLALLSKWPTSSRPLSTSTTSSSGDNRSQHTTQWAKTPAHWPLASSVSGAIPCSMTHCFRVNGSPRRKIKGRSQGRTNKLVSRVAKPKTVTKLSRASSRGKSSLPSPPPSPERSRLPLDACPNGRTFGQTHDNRRGKCFKAAANSPEYFFSIASREPLPGKNTCHPEDLANVQANPRNDMKCRYTPNNKNIKPCPTSPTIPRISPIEHSYTPAEDFSYPISKSLPDCVTGGLSQVPQVYDYKWPSQEQWQVLDESPIEIGSKNIRKDEQVRLPFQPWIGHCPASPHKNWRAWEKIAHGKKSEELARPTATEVSNTPAMPLHPTVPCKDEFEDLEQVSYPNPAIIEIAIPEAEAREVSGGMHDSGVEKLLEDGGIEFFQAPFLYQAAEGSESRYSIVDMRNVTLEDLLTPGFFPLP